MVSSLLSVPLMWSHRCSLGESAGPGGSGETGSRSVRQQRGPNGRAADILGEKERGVDTARDKWETGEILSNSSAGRGKEEEYQPFLFSDGFPPVPAKLVGKFLRLEFVDMTELLRNNIEAKRRQGRQRETTGVPAKQQHRREIPDILSWIQCFGTYMYVSVVASKFPERVSGMLAYQTTLVREARRCGGGGWAAYDMAFRQQAATDKECDWSKLNSSLYPVTFMAQATQQGGARAAPTAWRWTTWETSVRCHPSPGRRGHR